MNGLDGAGTLLSQRRSVFIGNYAALVNNDHPVTDGLNLLQDMGGQEDSLFFSYGGLWRS